MIGFTKALQLTLEAITPLEAEMVSLFSLVNRIVASDLPALVNAPERDVSLKDGYAVHSADIAQASPECPVELRIIGTASAGGHFDGQVTSGSAVRIWSGAGIPEGADAVLAEEFARLQDDQVFATAGAEAGRNILPKGTDNHVGQKLVSAGTLLSRPTQIGLLAAAGYSQVPVFRQPRVAIVATGSEVIAPGQALEKGKVFASNLVTLASWCSLHGFGSAVWIVKDDAEMIRDRLLEAIADADAVLTSGGAWRGDHDLVARILDQLGWQKIYHRVRMGPGKAAGFGLWQGKPVFCLPGGPPSNQMAFVQLALPGLQKLAGYCRPGLKRVKAGLAHSVSGQEDWTQFLEGRFEFVDDSVLFRPAKLKSRLQGLAATEGILTIPEGTTQIQVGSIVRVQLAPGYQLVDKEGNVDGH
ncbi:MAG: molybdopterin molybdenumtransferase MoeA [Deltaproteobacteria bacterium HGW-Deltaproteobacteria-21]|nr:MAG: molybdopterin molybdenumtransferase MoeA [Deltaproteobacteria bacterium HGW-Deltaproteobacteria-21]